MASERSEFTAPWSTALRWLTVFSVGIVLTVAALGLFTGPRGEWIWFVSMVVLPLSIAIGAAFFVIRGYEITGGALRVRRLGWDSVWDLAGLEAVEVDPEAMKWSIRTFGNGGMFCFAGWFRNRKLGSYRALVTDPKRSVVLRFADRTLVVSPDDPEAFTERVRAVARAGWGAPGPRRPDVGSKRPK